MIKSLPPSIENDFYKNNRKLIKSEKIRHEQYKELSNKDEELKYYKNAFSKLSRDLDIITKRRPMPYVHNYISFAESVDIKILFINLKDVMNFETK